MSAKTHLMIVYTQKNTKNRAQTSGECSLMSAFQVLAPPLHPEREKFEKQSLSQLGVYTKNFEKTGYVFFHEFLNNFQKIQIFKSHCINPDYQYIYYFYIFI